MARAAVLVLAALACRGEPPSAVDRVVVADSEAARSLAGLGIAPEVLGQEASRILDRAPGFTTASRAGAKGRHYLGQLQIQRAEVIATAEGPRAVVLVGLQLTPIRNGHPMRELGRGAAPVGTGGSGLQVALHAAGVEAVRAAVDGFAAQLGAERKRNKELLGDLASTDPRLRERAMRVLAERGDRDAVPALVSRLQDPDPEVVERAVGALAQLRDPRAVPALVALAHRRDPQYVSNMARIVGDIGGPDARAWLLTMASGHPDARVRSAAHDALAEMDAREPQARAAQGAP